MVRPATPGEALQAFSRLSPSTIRLGLDRIRAALLQLGSPERAYPGLHVAGTNGKGSTCAFADACLGAQGLKVGLYTSPHLERVNERIRVGGLEISDGAFGERLLEVFTRCPEALEEPPELTYFEVGTLAALLHFAREKVDVAVLETGLGGQLDATTAARADVTALTSISIDHTNLLGSTLAQIASAKAGILRPGVPAVVARQEREALKVVLRVAREVGAPLLLEGRDFKVERRGGQLRYEGPGRVLTSFALGLRGEHQLQNAAVAIASLDALARAGLGIRLGDPALRDGLAGTIWPGRLEELPLAPPVLLDGAHNEGGARILAAALESLYPGRRVHLVFGVLADKDHAAIRRLLFPRCATVHLCPVPSPRSLSPAAYLDDARSLCPSATAYPDWQGALEGARRAAAPEDLVLCAGSLFLIGAVRPKLRNEQLPAPVAR